MHLVHFHSSIPSPSTTLKFHTTDYDNFHPYTALMPSDLNGTLSTAALSALCRPSFTLKTLTLSSTTSLSILSWAKLKLTLGSLALEASFEIEARINRAFADYDICEICSKVTDLLPSLSLPSMSEVSRGVDKLADMLQALLERAPPRTKFEDEGVQGVQWVFAARMGEKVRRSLVEQGICRGWQVMPTRGNLCWQMGLNQALNQLFLFQESEFSLSRLMELEPVWVADRIGKRWSLELDTLVVDLKRVDGEIVDVQPRLRTGFSLPEYAASVSIEDYCRKTRTVNDEWEMFE